MLKNITMTKQSTNPIYLLRFIAAFLILIYHFFPSPLQKQYHFRNLDEAVNFFFFISGFVMVVSNASFFSGKKAPESFNKANYWVKRFAKIYPSYFLAFFLVVLFNYTVKCIYPSIPQRSVFEIFGIQRWLYGGSINFPAWTISIEFFFYMIFPFTVTWLANTSIKKVAALVITVFIFSLIITTTIGLFFVNRQYSKSANMVIGTFYRHPIFEYAIFLLGNFCGVCFVRNISFGITKNILHVILVITSLGVISGVIFLLPAPNPLIAAGILAPVYFVFITSICRLQGGFEKMLSNKLFIFLGNISFGIYIFQIPVMLFYDHFKGNDNAQLAFETVFDFLKYTFWLITFCCVIYILYEAPLKNFILKNYKRKIVKNNMRRGKMA